MAQTFAGDEIRKAAHELRNQQVSEIAPILRRYGLDLGIFVRAAVKEVELFATNKIRGTGGLDLVSRDELSSGVRDALLKVLQKNSPEAAIELAISDYERNNKTTVSKMDKDKAMEIARTQGYDKAVEFLIKPEPIVRPKEYAKRD